MLCNIQLSYIYEVCETSVHTVNLAAVKYQNSSPTLPNFEASKETLLGQLRPSSQMFCLVFKFRELEIKSEFN